MEPMATTRSDTAANPAGQQPAAVVRVPGPLAALADGKTEVEARGDTVAEVLDDLLARHAGLRRHLRTEAGALREHVNVFLNEDDVRFLDGERTAVRPGDEVSIIPSIAGG